MVIGEEFRFERVERVGCLSGVTYCFLFADETKCPVCQGTVIAEGLC